MARFYSNENFPLPVVEALRTLGHDVLTIQETGRADQSLPDKEVLGFAAKEQRAVITFEPVALHPSASRTVQSRGDCRLHL